MRTPEEIKRALEFCNMPTNRKNICESCPYNGECTETGKPDQPGWDALLYIQKLEERIDLMLIQMRGDCGTCRFRFSTSDICTNCTNSWDGTYHPCWEYEGFPGEDTKHAESV